MNRNYQWRVTFTYWMKDGRCCESWNEGAREYGFTEKPYAPRSFKTLANAIRALYREDWSPVPQRYNESFRMVRNHTATKANPPVTFSIYASIK